MSATCIYYRH